MVFSRLLYCFDFMEDPVIWTLERYLTIQEQPIDTMRIPTQIHGHAPFKVIIKPRSAAHAELIRRECKAVADELKMLESDGKLTAKV